jgi:tetratricopeptide (TPR) repeat protein
MVVRQILFFAVLVAGLLAAAPGLYAQAPASGSTQNPPAGAQSAPAPVSGNPFPEDENSIPVIPARNTPDIPADTFDKAALVPAVDKDPVRSPDDAMDDNGPAVGFSSSRSGIDSLEPDADDTPLGKHRKKEETVVPEHQETSKEDLSVGQYYLDNKNWKAAMSRYESALVLDPENPDVFWGLAEAERHMGDVANARAHYLKVVEYDPDSRHGRDAAKALKDPALANAKAATDAAH